MPATARIVISQNPGVTAELTLIAWEKNDSHARYLVKRAVLLDHIPIGNRDTKGDHGVENLDVVYRHSLSQDRLGRTRARFQTDQSIIGII
jgi:hypothetical protein